MAHPLGGFARRARFLKEFAAAFPDAAYLVLDAGNLFAARSPEWGLINRFMLKGLEMFGVKAANVTAEDLNFLAELPAREAASLPFVSANIRPLRNGLVRPKPYTVARAKGFKVGILGLADEAKQNYPRELFQISDPLEAARRLVPELRKQCDLVIALADLSSEKVRRLAVENPDLSVIIWSNKLAYPRQPEVVNGVMIMITPYQGRYLCELRVYAKGGRAELKPRYIMLDARIPDDPETARAAAMARASISALQRELAEERQAAATAGLRELAGASRYVGSARCASCHTAAHQVWVASAHAHAIDTLKAKGQEFNPQCLKCHTTGFGAPGGFTDLLETPALTNVQCESCHGPGLEHVTAPRPGYGRAGRASCLSCHTSVDSPDFDFAAFWEKIKH